MPGGPVTSGSGSSTSLKWSGPPASQPLPSGGTGHVSFTYPPAEQPPAVSRSTAQHNVVQRSNWESGMATPPMPHKRKKTKKEKKKTKKGMISAPLNVRHVGTADVLEQLQAQSKFPVEHIATMSMEQQLASLSPNESLRHVRSLLQPGATWTKEVLLCLTPSALTVKDGATKISMLDIPLADIVRCDCLQDSGSQSSVLMVAVDNRTSPSEPQTHFFRCAKTPAEDICREITAARGSGSSDVMRQRKVGMAAQQNAEALQQNWVLQPKPQSSPPPPSHPPPPSTAPPPLPQQSTPTPPSALPPSLNTFFHAPPPPSSPSLPPTFTAAQGDQFTAGHQASPGPAAFHQALPHSVTDGREDSASLGSAGTPSRPHRQGEVLKAASSKYVSSVHSSRSHVEGGETSEIRRTMKASRIQRDVDILNHVIEDLDEFIKLLKTKTAAWNELEKKKKKSRRKKHDAVLEALRLKAEPPTEAEFKDTYGKCKFALNITAKLGHHLSTPSASELQAAIFTNYISHLVSINKGPQLASTVVSPLLTQHALELMQRNLPQAERDVWNRLGANWFLTAEKWPQSAPPPPDYQVKFTDGCIPPNLHNASDCPANFPTLDTLPRERRGLEYSDAYDMANQPESESGLLINPAVKAAVASQFAAVPDIVQKRGLRKTQSQQSLTSQDSQGEPPPHTARALFDYSATTLQELSIHKGERVEVVDDSRKWWKVKNYQGQVGYLPGNLLESILPKKKTELREGTDMIDVYGRMVPAPPKLAPPPAPSPSSRRPSISSAKYSPQHAHVGRKVSHQSPLSPLLEVSESASSTMHHPPLPPPPNFPPAPPHQNRSASTTAAPPPGPWGVPLPPPPPPVQPPKPALSLQDMIAQHKLKNKKEGKTRKPVLRNGNQEFDITAALKTRKPLRKTTKVNLIEGAGPGGRGSDLQQRLQSQLKGMKLSTEIEEPDMEYHILPWRADRQATKAWLIDQGYGDCAEKLAGQLKEGQQLYNMDREALRDVCGAADGIRLYSQLQKDRAQSEKEAGVVKESELQMIMRLRKTTVGDTGSGRGEPAMLKLRKPPQGLQECETVLDGGSTWRPRASSRGHTSRNVEHRDNQHYHGDGTTPRRRGRDDPDYHKGRKLTDDYEQARHGRRGEGGRSRRSSHYSDTISDDESTRRRRRRSGRSRRSSHYTDSQSESDDHSHGRRSRRRGKRERGKRPTNIDDFDERDYESESESSYSSDYSESESDSDSERGARRRLRSSASASAIPDAAWALQGRGREGLDNQSRIKSQQAEIKKLLNHLGELQTTSGVKTLPVEKQKVLQQDLQILESLQIRYKERPDNAGIFTQLIGQQILLSDHLRDAIESVKVKGLALSPSSGNLHFHLLHHQQQQQALAQQQQQQQRLLEAEQQQQQQQLLLAAAAEQQRQLQLAQMVSQQQQLLGLQSPGYGALGGMYSPVYTGMTYF